MAEFLDLREVELAGLKVAVEPLRPSSHVVEKQPCESSSRWHTVKLLSPFPVPLGRSLTRPPGHRIMTQTSEAEQRRVRAVSACSKGGLDCGKQIRIAEWLEQESD